MSCKNTIKNVWEKINKKSEDECWEWKGYTDKNGYGRIMINHITYRAHRIAYELTHGSIPKGLYVLHHCNNPPCCNPNHLYAGTQKDNMKQMIVDGHSCVGEKHPMGKLRGEDILKIKKLYSTGRYTLKEIGIMFGTSDKNIHLIKSNKRWKHIKEN